MRTIAESAMFAGLSGPDVIREDAAVAYLEQLGSTLKDLSPADRQAFARYVAALADAERSAGRNDRADFLASLCENLGLLETAN